MQAMDIALEPVHQVLEAKYLVALLHVVLDLEILIITENASVLVPLRDGGTQYQRPA